MHPALKPFLALALLLPASALGCSAIDFPGHVPRASAQLEESNISAMEISPDGSQVAVAEYTLACFHAADVVIETWGTGRGRRLLVHPGPNRGELIQSLAWSPDSRRLAYAAVVPGSGGGRIEILNVETGAVEHSFADPAMRRAQVAFTPDGRCLSTLAIHGSAFMSDWYPVDFRVRDIVSGEALETFQVPVLGGNAMLSSGGAMAWWDDKRGCLCLRTRGKGTTILGELGKPAKRHVAGYSFSPRGDYLLVFTLPRPFIYMDPMLPDRLAILELPGARIVHDQEWIPRTSRVPPFAEQKPPLIAATGSGELRVSRDFRTVVTADTGGVIKFWNAGELLEKTASDSGR